MSDDLLAIALPVVALALSVAIVVAFGAVIAAAHRRFEEGMQRRREERRARTEQLRADIEELRLECWEGVREIMGEAPCPHGHAWQPPDRGDGWPSLSGELELVELETGTVRARVYQVEHPDGRTWWVASTLDSRGRPINTVTAGTLAAAARRCVRMRQEGAP